MRRRRSGRHPRRLSDRSHRRDHGPAVRPVRPRRCGVLCAIGLSVVAWPRCRRARSAAGPADGALPAVTHRPHHAGLPGCGRGDFDVAPRRQGRSHGVAGEPVADPDLCAADADRRADPDVEPVRRGRLLPGAAVPCAAGDDDCRCGPGSRSSSRWRSPASGGRSSPSTCRSASIRSTGHQPSSPGSRRACCSPS